MMKKIKKFLLFIVSVIITSLIIVINILTQRDKNKEISTLKKEVKKRKENIENNKLELKEKEKDIKTSRQEIDNYLKLELNQKLKEKDEEIKKAREEYDNAQKINASDARRILNDFLDRTNSNGQ